LHELAIHKIGLSAAFASSNLDGTVSLA